MEQRDNGLEAERWLPLADVEAPLTDHVLAALAEASIAAIAVPTTSHDPTGLAAAWSSAAVGRWTGPSDRIEVDGSKRKQARELVDRLLPELRAELDQHRQRSEEAAWTQIVATLESDSEDGATQDFSTAKGPDPSAGAPTGDEWGDVAVPAPVGVPDELLDLDDDEHFVPPPAPPVPKADAVTRAAWTGVIGGPLFLVLATLLGWDADGLPALAAVGAFVGGFVTLVARMKDRPPLDESGDDGAVV